jgi:hypothetical protein
VNIVLPGVENVFVPATHWGHAAPQVICPPHPSEIVPQLAPALAHVVD